MADVTEDRVLSVLRTMIDPDLHKDIVSLGFVKDVEINDGQVGFTIELTTPACPVKAEFEEQAKQLVGALPGVKSVNVNMTAQVRSGVPEQSAMPGVKNIIAVGSGKGGVGKTTASVNLSIALAQTGASVGLLDGDVYGPNIPRMMGVSRQPKAQEIEVDGKKALRIVPLENYGIKMMSMGFIVGEDEAVVWRGPMLTKATQQMLHDVLWGELDYLVVDLPPGTGDVQISLCQLVPVTGAVMVTTPQKVAFADVLKGVAAFKRLNVPLFGVIENMSHFICPQCDHETDLFPRGSVEKECEERKLKFLGSIPFVQEVAYGGDEGKPVVTTHPDSVATQSLKSVAQALAASVSTQVMRKQRFSEDDMLPISPAQ